ncbi:MAG: adenosine kinase [Lentisphaerae bacterium]|nr:adenosine kinase [Lentisphaerota bacterium]
MSFKLLGVGSPLIDFSLDVTDSFLAGKVPGGKGGTRNITAEEKNALLAGFTGRISRTPGGSAANTVRIFAALSGQAAFFGKTGDDDDGRFFRDSLTAAGVDDRWLVSDRDHATGFCVSLITPDAERTMLSGLGASVKISDSDIGRTDFSGFSTVLVEGYLCGEKWMDELLAKARAAGCRIALDLNNFELVAKIRPRFRQLLESGIDLLFANGQELAALYPDASGEAERHRLISRQVPLAVIKYGKDGSIVLHGNDLLRIDAEKNICVRDTTGAGDFYAAGFLYGLSRGADLRKCGRLGSVCAAAIIRITGAVLDKEELDKLYNIIKREVEL